MTEIEKLNGKVEHLETLLQAKLGVRGRTLARRFARAGRLLPKRIQKAGRVITDAQAVAHHPKLARQHDARTIDAAFTEITSYLKTIDPADRRKGLILGMLGSAVFNVMILMAVLIAFLRWQNVI